jgi:hypothetical protein
MLKTNEELVTDVWSSAHLALYLLVLYVALITH